MIIICHTKYDITQETKTKMSKKAILNWRNPNYKKMMSESHK